MRLAKRSRLRRGRMICYRLLFEAGAEGMLLADEGEALEMYGR